jgi:hypothetical protein
MKFDRMKSKSVYHLKEQGEIMKLVMIDVIFDAIYCVISDA